MAVIPRATAIRIFREGSGLRRLAPGVALAAAVAAGALLGARIFGLLVPIPPMVVALMLGIGLNRVAAKAVFRPGLGFCAGTLLRWAVALLGVRIALADIVALGPGAAFIVLCGMGLTIAAGLRLARSLDRPQAYGMLAGAATAICGASATLATATVVPDYRGKSADIAFVIVAVNGLSTGAMLLYPPLCALLGFDPATTGIMLGATIHDVAQVVGAGYGVSEAVGNTAVIVKLFRVFLLLPVMLVAAWWFRRARHADGQARLPVPLFALAFLGLCVLNSAVRATPGLGAAFAPIRAGLIELSNLGLLVAIGAIGLGTSMAAILSLGWRHVAPVAGATLVLLVAVTCGLLLLR